MFSSCSQTTNQITRRHFLRTGVRYGVLGAATLLGGGAYAAQVEPDWVEIERIELVLPRLPRSFDGFRISHISDIHIEGGDMARHFPAICDLVSAQGADAIVLTGDYTAYEGKWQGEALFHGFRRLRAPAGVFATLGNHDHGRSGDIVPKTGARLVKKAFQRAGVRELPNQAIALRRGTDFLWMAGMDDAMTGNHDLEALQAQIPTGSATVLLHHEPDFADEFGPSGCFDLMLSGHSHGGQIAMPFYGPLRLPPHSLKYPRGLYHVGEMALYTNRGLGTIALPLRFCARPEITLFTLKSG